MKTYLLLFLLALVPFFLRVDFGKSEKPARPAEGAPATVEKTRPAATPDDSSSRATPTQPASPEDQKKS